MNWLPWLPRAGHRNDSQSIMWKDTKACWVLLLLLNNTIYFLEAKEHYRVSAQEILKNSDNSWHTEVGFLTLCGGCWHSLKNNISCLPSAGKICLV